jgi:S-DNA-T family DNA segregation ATPase FtsK/SpoIIIE
MATNARWRLDHGGIHDVEVDLHPSTTVGELARALENHVDSRRHRELTAAEADPAPDDGVRRRARRGLTIETEFGLLDPAGSARESVPPSGSTIRLARCSDPESWGPNGNAAPVTMSGPFGRSRLHYGRNAVSEGVALYVGHDVVLTDEGTGLLYADGALVRGHVGLHNGAMIRRGDWAASLQIHAALSPPTTRGAARRVPIQRGQWSDHIPDPVDIPPAPERFRPPGFPWLTAMVPLLMAAAMWAAIRSLLMVGFMAFSFVYVLASGIESRWEARRADRDRVADFREELGDVARDLEERVDAQESRDGIQHPSLEETMSWSRPLSHRLWERSGLHPHPLSVRLGSAELPPDDPAVGRARGRPELRPELQALLEHNEPRRRPLTVELEETGGLAIVGEHHMVTSLGASLVAQLAMLTPPDQLEFELMVPAKLWQWAFWLPHLRSGAKRKLLTFHRVGSEQAPCTGGPVLWLAGDTVGLPDSIRAVVRIDGAGRSTLQVDNSPALPFEPETHSTTAIEVAARRIAALMPGTTTSATSLPREVSLGDVGSPLRGDAMARAWKGSRSPGIAVPLGRLAGGGILSLDLVADGPHALVGGTTGSGKSELLRTMLATIVAGHSPARVNLLLVDYKGGAAFGPLAHLPHCVGLLTDLGPAEVARNLSGLRAELHRREQILDAHGASEVRGLDEALRPPSLLLVVDEFATLVKEVPDFLEGVLDVAQRGRSLGMHMILATQRPTGVVSDAVKANTSLRIALRLPDGDDSDDVVGSRAAAELPRDIPGRALVRLGHDALLTTQVAYSGGPLVDDETVEVRPLGTPPGRRAHSENGPTELEALVNAARAANDLLDLPAPRRPVPPPLPERLPMAELTGRDDLPLPTDTTAPFAIGLLDRPREQIRKPLTVDPMGNGGLMVIGGPGSGTSTTLMAVAVAADARGGWDVHAIDTDGGLSGLAGIESVCTLVSASDHEGVRRLIDSLLLGTADRPTLLLVDGFASFEEQQAPVNRGEATELLVRLANEGRAHNVATAVSVRQRSHVPFGLFNAIGERLLLRMLDADQALAMDGPEGLAERGLPPGRGWVRGDWVQVVLPEAPAPGTCPPETPRLPADLAVAQVLEAATTASPTGAGTNGANRDGSRTGDLVLPIGLDARDLSTSWLDLGTGHAIVAGAPRSGRSTALGTVRRVAGDRGIRCHTAGEPAAMLAALLAHGSSPDCAPGLGFMDDFDELAEDSEIDELVCEVIRMGRDRPIRLVVGADSQRLARCYADCVNRLRNSRTGLLLGADAHEHGALLHQDIRPRQDIPPAAGRGWLVDPRGCRIVQVAH